MSVVPPWSRTTPTPPPPSPASSAEAATAADPPAAIRLTGVRKRYGRHLALAGIDLDVAAGSSVALTGANGAGKSTLLNVISGLSPHTSGRVEVVGARPGAGHRSSGPLLGVLNHAAMLYDRLTGRENLALHATLRGLPTARIDEVLAQVDLTEAAERPVRTYSHGMRKRLSLARLLLHEPEVLVLDEPFSGLDAASCDRLAGVIASLRGTRTIIFSTHDAERAHALADRALVVAGGRITADHETALSPTPAVAPPSATTGRGAASSAGSVPATAPVLRRRDGAPSGSPLARFALATLAMLRKDVLIETRARSVSTAMLVLAGLLAVVLGMAFEPLATDPAVLSGALWVLITFAVMHGLSRSFDAEFEDDALKGLLLTGADPAALYLGKIISTTLFLLLVSLTSIGLISVFFAAPGLLEALPGLLALVALAAVGLTAVGGVVTVMARHSNLGETLLPLLFLPLVVPVLLAGIASVPVLLETGTLDPAWLRVLVAYDVGMLVATTVFFEHLLEG